MANFTFTELSACFLPRRSNLSLNLPSNLSRPVSGSTEDAPEFGPLEGP